MKLYTLKGLARLYGQRPVLDIPHLDIEQGKICAVLGANGAGKTTLLNLLAFMDEPSAGQISYCSSKVRFVEKELLALRRQVVLVDQKPLLFSRTVFKNLEYGLKLRGVNKKERTCRIEKALDLVGMRQFIDLPAINLSGGETQRVALARALVLKPQVLLCDEPTANLDVENQGVIINLLHQLNKEQSMSVIFTTHDTHLASSLAHQTVHLAHGQVESCAGENRFSVAMQLDEQGRVTGELSSGMVLVLGKERGEVRLDKEMICCIDPHHIAFVSEHGKKPDCNLFKGVVQKIALQNQHIHVVVEAGASFSVIMDKEHYRERSLLVGSEVSFYIPPQTIELIQER